MFSAGKAARFPSFGYKSNISICRRFGFIRKGKVTDGARFDGRMLRDVVTNDNTASDVWADTAYRSQANERWLRRNGKVSRIHRKKPKGKPMPERTAKANAAIQRARPRGARPAMPSTPSWSQPAKTFACASHG
jgi:IS5 family transposase